MGGVCLSVRRGTCTRACRRAQIAAPAFLGHNHWLSKKLNSPLSSIRLIIRIRGHPPTDPVYAEGYAMLWDYLKTLITLRMTLQTLCMCEIGRASCRERV